MPRSSWFRIKHTRRHRKENQEKVWKRMERINVKDVWRDRKEIIRKLSWSKGISHCQGGWMVWPLQSDPGGREVLMQQDKSHSSWLTLLLFQIQPPWPQTLLVIRGRASRRDRMGGGTTISSTGKAASSPWLPGPAPSTWHRQWLILLVGTA